MLGFSAAAAARAGPTEERPIPIAIATETVAATNRSPPVRMAPDTLT